VLREVIRLAEDGYGESGAGYTCLECSALPAEITGLAPRQTKR
jgi:hypothetical protein